MQVEIIAGLHQNVFLEEWQRSCPGLPTTLVSEVCREASMHVHRAYCNG